MRKDDLPQVIQIEEDIYPFPWTLGNFQDSLDAGYDCWVCQYSADIIGYAILMRGVDDVHLLNLSIARRWQQQGYGRYCLQAIIDFTQNLGLRRLLLEVRMSNQVGLNLYHSSGFRNINIRKGYYPVHNATKEDALVLELDIVSKESIVLC